MVSVSGRVGLVFVFCRLLSDRRRWDILGFGTDHYYFQII